MGSGFPRHGGGAARASQKSAQAEVQRAAALCRGAGCPRKTVLSQGGRAGKKDFCEALVDDWSVLAAKRRSIVYYSYLFQLFNARFLFTLAQGDTCGS